jgi:hypothetical protein
MASDRGGSQSGANGLVIVVLGLACGQVGPRMLPAPRRRTGSP